MSATHAQIAPARVDIPTQSIHPAEAYSIEGFCKAYSLARSTVYDLIKDGRLRAVKCGARTLITRKAAEDWLASLPALNTAA